VATPLRPGIHGEEIPCQSRRIEGAKTSVAAFVGFAAGGPVARPIRVSSSSQFAKIYLDPHEPDQGAPTYMAKAVYGFFQNGGGNCWAVRVGGTRATESSTSDRVATLREGISGLSAIEEITMVCVPDAVALAKERDDTSVCDLQRSLIAHCEEAGNRMAILDPPPTLQPQEILDWRLNVAGYDSSFAALYWPWIEVIDPLSNRRIAIPPSGHISGVWARTDNNRGVHKAPADGSVLDVGELASDIGDDEQGALNEAGVNCIRSFRGRGIRVWGARTMSSDPEWRYLNVRRLFNYVSQSILEGTRWVAFEPNDEELWTKLRCSISDFLTRLWQEGALFGASPEQAFYVKCDQETNSPEVIEAGQVVAEIGIAPVRAADFIVFRISPFTANAPDVSPKVV
jgi:phage tail sheath protein FI